ncbi:hypothetical protein PSPO01_11469 [Paraphaeosphaeria sporulosa]
MPRTARSLVENRAWALLSLQLKVSQSKARCRAIPQSDAQQPLARATAHYLTPPGDPPVEQAVLASPMLHVNWPPHRLFTTD